MKILDSDLIIGFLREDPEAVRKMSSLKEEGNFATTALNAQEVLFGPYHTGRLDEFERAAKLLKSVSVLDYDFGSMLHNIRIKSKLLNLGKQIGEIDEMVASVCLSHNATIVTRNVDHFSRVPNLKVEKW